MAPIALSGASKCNPPSESIVFTRTAATRECSLAYLCKEEINTTLGGGRHRLRFLRVKANFVGSSDAKPRLGEAFDALDARKVCIFSPKFERKAL